LICTEKGLVYLATVFDVLLTYLRGFTAFRTDFY